MFLINNEDRIVQNIVNKLNLYMEKNKLSTLNMAKNLGFSYQNLNWLVKHKRTPTIGSLVQLCELFHCNLQELISSSYFLDVPYYEKILHYLNEGKTKKIRIYIPEEDIEYIHNNKFFVISNKKEFNIYYGADNIVQDGQYLVNYKDENILINVLFSSSKMVIIEHNDTEIKIPTEEIRPIAKLYKPCFLLKDTNETLLAKFLPEDSLNA